MKKIKFTKSVLFLLSVVPIQTILATETLSDLLKSSENPDLGFQLEFQINEQLPKFQFYLVRDTLADLESGTSGEIIIDRIDISTQTSNEIGQTLNVNQAIPSREVDYYFETQDINFDGYQDIRLIASWGATGNSNYHYWLYDIDAGLFEYNEEISNLDNPYPDPETKTITTSWIGGRMGAIYAEETFKIHNGVLEVIRQENQLWDEQENHFIKIIKEVQNEKLEIISEEIIKEEDA